MTDGASERRAGFLSGLVVGAAAALAGAALVFGFPDDDDDSLVAQARDMIESRYFEEVPASALDESSVRGMVADLRKRYDDRFSHYFTPEEFAEFSHATSGEFQGVGLTVTEVARGLRVADVLPDSPARDAGMSPGDVITAVEGRSIEGVSSDVSTARIKGEPGTEVTITVDPVGPKGPGELTLERANVRLPAASGRIERTPGGTKTAYVRFATFSRGAHGELRDEIERLGRKGAEALVLDLRGNGGGLLQEAVLSSSLFVEEGDDVVTTRSRVEGETVYDSQGGTLEARPTVVLVNRDTASAAEILSAAIQSYDVGTILGENTYGKGTFQEVTELPAGGALDLTVGEYLTAEGVSLAGEGVQPDERGVDDPRTEPDEALDEALALLDQGP